MPTRVITAGEGVFVWVNGLVGNCVDCCGLVGNCVDSCRYLCVCVSM